MANDTCKTKIIVEKKVCQDNLVEEISHLINEEGMSERAACKKYVKDFNKNNKDKGITAKFNTVYKAYRRATQAPAKNEKKVTLDKIKSGHIYIATNPLYEGLVKIGKTTRTSEIRIGELNSEAMLVDFELYNSYRFNNVSKAESIIHSILSSRRAAKEFFEVDKEIAALVVKTQQDLETVIGG